MSYGQERRNLQQLTHLIAKTSFQMIRTLKYLSKNNLRTFQAQNREIFKNSQLQTNSTASYEKRV